MRHDTSNENNGFLYPHFQKKYPNVKFSVQNGNTDFIIESIDNGIIDIGFVIDPIDLTKFQSIALPTSETWGLLLRKDDPLASLPAIKPSDLLAIPLINSRRVQTQNVFQEWMNGDFNQLRFVAEADLTSLATILVKNHVGGAIVLNSPDIPDDLIFKPLEPALHT